MHRVLFRKFNHNQNSSNLAKQPGFFNLLLALGWMFKLWGGSILLLTSILRSHPFLVIWKENDQFSLIITEDIGRLISCAFGCLQPIPLLLPHFQKLALFSFPQSQVQSNCADTTCWGYHISFLFPFQWIYIQSTPGFYEKHFKSFSGLYFNIMHCHRPVLVSLVFFFSIFSFFATVAFSHFCNPVCENSHLTLQLSQINFRVHFLYI